MEKAIAMEAYERAAELRDEIRAHQQKRSSRDPMFSSRRALALILGAALLAGCDINPHPAPLRKTREDGTPWRVRYAYLADDPRGLDPQHAYDQMSHRIQEATADTPLEYHPLEDGSF